jgi:acyl-CoA synthetase (AMP-forming)/AMP-acid ligase II
MAIADYVSALSVTELEADERRECRVATTQGCCRLNPGRFAHLRGAARLLSRLLVPEDIGLLLYTSGTTGAPKGACSPTVTSFITRGHARHILSSTRRRASSRGAAILRPGFGVQMLGAFAAAAQTIRLRPNKVEKTL